MQPERVYALSTFTLSIALFTILSIQGDSLAAQVLAQYGPFGVVLYLIYQRMDTLEEEVKENTIQLREELARMEAEEGGE